MPASWKTVVEIGRELPGVEESTSYGTPALKVRGKLFARAHQDGENLVLFCDYLEREALTQSEPDVFHFTDHYREWPMILVRLKKVGRRDLREAVIESWCRRAPQRLVSEYEAANPSQQG
jgi:hypothetical protein